MGAQRVIGHELTIEDIDKMRAEELGAEATQALGDKAIELTNMETDDE